MSSKKAVAIVALGCAAGFCVGRALRPAPPAPQLRGRLPDFVERRCLEYVFENADKGNPTSVVDAIDRFCWEGNWMMNLGDTKGKLVDDIVRNAVTAAPKRDLVMLELGTYCGYSAIRLAQLLPKGSRYITFEPRPLIASIATKIIEYAGLRDTITVVVGGLESHLEGTVKELGIASIDIAFIDHWKDLYVPDLLRLEEAGLIQAGATVIADNIKYPGAPAYRQLMLNNTGNYNTVFLESHLEYSTKEDEVAVSSCIRSAPGPFNSLEGVVSSGHVATRAGGTHPSGCSCGEHQPTEN